MTTKRYISVGHKLSSFAQEEGLEKAITQLQDFRKDDKIDASGTQLDPGSVFKYEHSHFQKYF